MRQSLIPAAGILALAISAARPAAVHAITPDNPGAANVRFTVDSATTKPISPYIYGANGTSVYNAPTMDRIGGNRLTGYNWETNWSNAGRDWYYQNDTHMGNGAPGQAIEGGLDAAAAANRAIVVTAPINGYVAGDTAGPITRAQALDKSRFKEIVPLKETKYPGSSLSLAPNETDGFVFTDEFVNWVEQNKGDATVFYNLDNEPGLWGETLPVGWQPGVPTSVQPSPQGRTHGALHPYAPTFNELKQKTIDHAAAIKSVNPAAMVFGGVGYGWQDFVSLQDAPGAVTSPSHPGGDAPSGEMHYYEWLLNEVRKEDDARGLTAQGKTLMDVLDLHWYPEAQGGGVRISFDNSANPSAALVQARVQAPRSLWDPTYTETSWITQWGTWQGSPGTPGPIKLLERVERDINDFKPGTKIAVTEYNYGGGRHISGGVAQADVLGIFGREDVFAAAMWPIDSGNNSRFTAGGFKMYLDYDGASGNGKFGDLSITANTDKIADSAVYASLDSNDPSRMVLVAINRTTTDKTTAIEVTHDLRFTSAEVYQLKGTNPNPERVADISIDLVNAFLYTMPALSVSTLVLHAAPEGDFNNDGFVDAADAAAWTAGLGMSTGAELGDGDYDGDHDVDGADFLSWQRGFGTAPSIAAIPEPSGLALAAPLLVYFFSRKGAKQD
jgi:hypothetical protein